MGGYWVYNANRFIKRSKWIEGRPNWAVRLFVFFAFAATWSETGEKQ